MKPEAEVVAIQMANSLMVISSGSGDILDGGGDMGDFGDGMPMDAPGLSPNDLLGIPGVHSILGI